ncbi:MAG: hypothetical protein JSS65_07240, partial [Armatimonadetes bacterium]|nr:hypothetical protein [Armatimonadota bacterium]
MSANPVPPDKDLLTAQYKDGEFDALIGDIVLSQAPHNEPAIALPVPMVKGLKSSPWQIFLAAGFLGVNLLLLSITFLLMYGIGVWGNNQPVGWGFDIINFVWWIG